MASSDGSAVTVPETGTALPAVRPPAAGALGAEAADAGWQTLVGPRASAPRPPSVRRVLVQVAIAVVVAFAVVALSGILVFQRIAKQEAVHQVAEVTDILAESVVQPALTDAMAGDAAQATAGLDPLIRKGILATQVVRVKLWSPQGLVLYSDERRLIGQRFALDDEARQALTAPRTEAGISDLDRPENALESAAGKLLEVYRPVWTPSGKPLLFEAYFRYDLVSQRSDELWRGFSGVMLSSLAAVLVLLAPLLWLFYRRARSAQLQRERLMRRALDASTEERRRIAATLHDGVVQQLAGAAFLVGGEVERAGAQGDPARAQRLAEAAATVRDGVAGMRSLLVDIYPPSLTAGGLAAALADLVRTQSGAAVNIRLQVDPAAAAALDAEQQQAVFRVAQECLRNAVRHAEATTIWVELSQQARDVRLEVADDGRGLAPDRVEQAAAAGHFGLRLIADVAVGVGARLSVAGSGPGTRFRMEVPT
ncbi:MAG: two-component system, NarL family, sensor histidine kinase UhpB [Pseudonocardiales bacterium]|jgi:signal transduction histidine kinase|nr:two-component system, NarL family, sensor histidine kinase UhpB [Pseudonocardiales bacterium]